MYAMFVDSSMFDLFGGCILQTNRIHFDTVCDLLALCYAYYTQPTYNNSVHFYHLHRIQPYETSMSKYKIHCMCFGIDETYKELCFIRHKEKLVSLFQLKSFRKAYLTCCLSVCKWRRCKCIYDIKKESLITETVFTSQQYSIVSRKFTRKFEDRLIGQR